MHNICSLGKPTCKRIISSWGFVNYVMLESQLQNCERNEKDMIFNAFITNKKIWSNIAEPSGNTFLFVMPLGFWFNLKHASRVCLLLFTLQMEMGSLMITLLKEGGSTRVLALVKWYFTVWLTLLCQFKTWGRKSNSRKIIIFEYGAISLRNISPAFFPPVNYFGRHKHDSY